MFDWFRRIRRGQKSSKKLLLEKSFPKELSSSIVRIENLLLKSGSRIEPSIHWSEDKEDVHVELDLLKIPTRVYFSEIESTHYDQLNDLQRLILSCIFSRHYDGHIREKHAKQILLRSELFVPAYVIRLLAEYVVEIGVDILAQADKLDRSTYGNFLRQNPQIVDLTNQRITSYWNEYYRRPHATRNWSRLEDFPPHKVWKLMLTWAAEK